MRCVPIATALLLAAGSGVLPISAAIFDVDRLDDEPTATDCNLAVAIDCSLRGAVSASNLTPGKDTIRLPAGTFPLSHGELVLSDDVEVQGADGATSVIRQETSLRRVLNISASDVLLSNLILTGGWGDELDSGGGIQHLGGGRLELRDCAVADNRLDPLGFGAGGGIYSNGGTVTLVDSEVDSNQSPHEGAGISIVGGTLTLLRSTVTNNLGSSGAGVTAHNSQVVVQDSEISGNESRSGAGAGMSLGGGSITVFKSHFQANRASAYGGAIWLRNGAELSVTDSVLEDNFARLEGGAIWSDGTVEIFGSTLNGNRVGTDTTGLGGGIYAEDGSNTTVTGSLFVDNESVQEAGGIYIDIGASVTVTNSTFSGNSAGSFGGAIENGGTLNLASTTFSGNSAGVNGAAINYSVGTTNLKNTLIDGTCGAFLLNINSQGGNLESPGDTCFLDAPSDQVNVSSQNLALGALADNGGPTLTHALLAGSVAIDGGVASCPPVDQRSYLRVDGTCDVGAFEADAQTPGLPFSDGFESGDTSAWSSTVP